MILIGWDVGGWNCDNNPKSRDALVVLNAERQIMGKPWRGNLRSTINASSTTKAFVHSLLALCRIDIHDLEVCKVTLAIDTPLGFSRPLIDLLTLGKTAPAIGVASENPYLHRQTEHFLFRKGLSPLSPIKDMIGSQATKGMHVLGRFASIREHCGVWTDGQLLRAIEAYPSATRTSAAMAELQASFYREAVIDGETIRQFTDGLEHIDHQDALTCALLAWMFVFQPEALAHPLPDVDPLEGWIFVPADGLKERVSVTSETLCHE
ncbi:DUF429 domain-containing protein [Pseudomonas sp. 3A(2025)]